MRIRVHAPFRLRTEDGVLEFPRGEHVLRDALLKLPVMKAWQSAGRFEVLDRKQGDKK